VSGSVIVLLAIAIIEQFGVLDISPQLQQSSNCVKGKIVGELIGVEYEPSLLFAIAMLYVCVMIPILLPVLFYLYILYY